MKNMVCKKCGAEITEGSRFCGECGAPAEGTAKKKPIVPIAAGVAGLLLLGAVGVGSAFLFGKNSDPEPEKTTERVWDSSEQAESGKNSADETQSEEPEGSVENAADEMQSGEPLWASLTPVYSITDVPSIELYASNYTPNEKSQGIVWDSKLLYWLEDINLNSSEDGYLSQCRITKNLLRNAESGNLIQYEIYRDPNTDEVYKIVSIEQSGGGLQLVDYYYQGGMPNFAFAREDSVYTPTYATPSKTGERYYFNNDTLVRWRMVREPGRIQEYVLTSGKVPYSQSNYFNESEAIRASYDETEMRMLNAAKNTYAAIMAASPTGAVEGYVADTAGMPLGGVTVDIVSAADSTLLYRGVTADDGTFHILAYLDGTECNVIFRETEIYQESIVHGMILAQSGAGSCGTVLMHRFDGDEYPVHINIYSAAEVRSGDGGWVRQPIGSGQRLRLRGHVYQLSGAGQF